MTSFTLDWPVKDSLISYMQTLEDGSVVAIDPAVRSETSFIFAADDQASNFDPATNTGTLQFQGTAQFSGYGGMMNIIIKNPLLELNGETGVLLIAVGGLLSPETLLPLAQLSIVPGSSPLQATVNLTAEGRTVLGEQYSVGQELSPLTVIAS